MSFASLLIHTCDIKRFTEGAADGYGNPAKTWANVYTTQPCRLVATGGREVKKDAEVVISNWQLFLDDSVTVSEQDRISNICYSDGTVLDGSTFEILLVQLRSSGTLHHYEMALQKVK